jgi:ATP-binding cassette subfamily F protein uup
MPQLRAEIASLEQTLSDPDIFAKDAALFTTAAKRLEAARAEHAAAESEWLTIELQREALAPES